MNEKYRALILGVTSCLFALKNIIAFISLALTCSFSYGLGQMNALSFKLDKHVVLREGDRHEFDFDIGDDCVYEVGISFSGDREKIEGVLGKYPNINLPAEVYLKLTDSDSNIVYENKSFTGKGIGRRGAPPKVMVVAGWKKLTKNKYRLVAEIKKVTRELGQVKTNFFVIEMPKVDCK